MSGAVFTARTELLGAAMRSEARTPATGILTLSPPQNGAASIFDAHDYAVIDFLLIDNQWAALVQVGLTLQIVFPNGAIIELLNFFSSSAVYDASSGEEHTGSVLGDPDGPLLRTSSSQMLSSKDFAQAYWITKSSGTFLITFPSEFHNGEQALGAEAGLHPSDTLPPLPILPDLFKPIFPLLPLFVPQPPLPLPPPTNGTNVPAVITGTATGAVTEAGGVNNGTPGIPTATGDLDSTDVDNPNDAWTVAGSPTANGYGSYTLTAVGVWTYTLDNNNATVQALNVGQTLTDTFTVTTVDGTAQLVTITINGANDAAVITGTTTGAVTEAGGVNNGTLGTPLVVGNLNSTDVDNPNNTWTAVAASTPGDNDFGSYRLTAAGVWAYTLDNSNPTVQALNVGGTLTDSFTVFTVDGTSQVVTITIHGANDAAVITGTATGAVTEAGGIANGTPGTPTATGDLNSTDVDNPPDDTWTAVGTTVSTSGYGSYTLTAAGCWTYTLDDSNATVQALNIGDTLADSFTVFTVDGTSQVVTITITGANDDAVITGTATGTVVEAGGVNNGTPGTPARCRQPQFHRCR